MMCVRESFFFICKATFLQKGRLFFTSWFKKVSKYPGVFRLQAFFPFPEGRLLFAFLFGRGMPDLRGRRRGRKGIIKILGEYEKMLYFYDATFWVYNSNIPVFWLPYYEMSDPSVKYKTGFLSPSFSSTNDMGTQFNIPFYINISDKHDLTTTFSYLTKENPLFQGEHRLNLTHSEFRTIGSFTHNKVGENRWHVFNNDKID